MLDGFLRLSVVVEQTDGCCSHCPRPLSEKYQITEPQDPKVGNVPMITISQSVADYVIQS